MNKTDELLTIITQLPIDFKKLNENLQKNHYTKQEMTEVVCEYIGMCFLERYYFEKENGRTPSDDEVHDTYLCKICEVFLEYGLDIFFTTQEDGLNIMLETLGQLTENDIAVNVIRLLLENSKKTNLKNNDAIISIFRGFDYKFFSTLISEGDTQLTDVRFRIWLLMIGYGATLENNECPVDLLNGFDNAQFRKCEKFRFEVEILDSKRFTVHIIQSQTGDEVAKVTPNMRRLDALEFGLCAFPLHKLRECSRILTSDA